MARRSVTVARGLLMLDERKRVVLIGAVFLILLIFSYFTNIIFFGTLDIIFQSQLSGFLMIFIHNVMVVSLILLGMTFYVKLIENDYFKREKHPQVVLEHPKTFAVVFAVIILLFGILRGANLIFGNIVIEMLPLIFLVNAPLGIVEGYGVYFAINKALTKTIVTKDLVCIYGIFLLAAAIEVGLVGVLS